MLFSDLNSLNEIISTTVRIHGTQYHDDNDPEVDRILNSSPPINESVLQTSYEYETMKTFNSQQKSYIYEDSAPATRQINNNLIHNNVTEAGTTSSSIINNANTIGTTTKNIPLSFTASKVPKKADLQKVKSLLTASLQNASNATANGAMGGGGGGGGKIKLTIYLPDFSPMNILCSDADTFDRVLRKILNQHKEDAKIPPLYYTNPEYYELRMHEGEGEPDRDFPALDRNKLLKAFNEKEYCLCQKEGLKISKNTLSSNKGDQSPQVNGNRHGSVAVPYEADILTIVIPGIAEAVKLPFDPVFMLSDGSGGDCGRDTEYSNRPSERERLFRDILPDIKETVEHRNPGYKLRLCTDEFVFVVPPDEQARFKLLSPYVTLNTPIASLGVRKFELQKRVFADSIRTQRISAMSRPQRKHAVTQGVVYSDTLANVYQEWNVKKKTKYGGFQDRVIGIDGKMLYTSKRDKRGLGAGTSSVARAQRRLDTIRSVELFVPNTTASANNISNNNSGGSGGSVGLDNEKKALRIIFEEDGGQIHEVEYICESMKDCGDILEKLKFLMKKKKAV